MGPGLQPRPARASFPLHFLSGSYQRSWASRTPGAPGAPWNHGRLLRGKHPPALTHQTPHNLATLPFGGLWVGGASEDSRWTPQGPSVQAGSVPRKAHGGPEIRPKQKWGAQGSRGGRRAWLLRSPRGWARGPEAQVGWAPHCLLPREQPQLPSHSGTLTRTPCLRKGST